MTFTNFDLEYIQSVWEQKVDINLTESGVHPIRLEDLLDGDTDKLAELMASEINYPHVNGDPELRQNIAALYNGAAVENVLVTVGAAEANNIIVQTIMQPGDEMACMTPTYKQAWGLALNQGHLVRPFQLMPDNGWVLDIDDLNKSVTSKTRIISIVNPNNPTGHIFSDEEMDAVVAAADRVGAWILADEVYRGAERIREDETPSFYGRRGCSPGHRFSGAVHATTGGNRQHDFAGGMVAILVIVGAYGHHPVCPATSGFND